jgi:DNA-binding NarL/FixJ family response regulator
MARVCPVRVGVADDHPVSLDGLARIVSRAAEALPTRVLVVSAVVDGARSARAMEAGAAGYVPKVAGDTAITDAIPSMVRSMAAPANVAPALPGGHFGQQPRRS